MIGRIVIRTPKCSFAIFAFLVGLAAFAIAQPQPPSLDVALGVSGSDGRWTVLTVAPDGSWGAATESMSNRAIANAIAECRFKYRAEIGCGGHQVAVQQGWIVGFRCGNANILAAGRTQAEAGESAIRRENDMRRFYVPDMPACRRTVLIDPRGRIRVNRVGAGFNDAVKSVPGP